MKKIRPIKPNDETKFYSNYREYAKNVHPTMTNNYRKMHGKPVLRGTENKSRNERLAVKYYVNKGVFKVTRLMNALKKLGLTAAEAASQFVGMFGF